MPVAIAIAGGTLIDGRGGSPLRDAVIVVSGERIRNDRTRHAGNLVVLDGDPRKSVESLSDVVLVMRSGDRVR